LRFANESHRRQVRGAGGRFGPRAPPPLPPPPGPDPGGDPEPDGAAADGQQFAIVAVAGGGGGGPPDDDPGGEDEEGGEAGHGRPPRQAATDQQIEKLLDLICSQKVFTEAALGKGSEMQRKKLKEVRNCLVRMLREHRLEKFEDLLGLLRNAKRFRGLRPLVCTLGRFFDETPAWSGVAVSMEAYSYEYLANLQVTFRTFCLQGMMRLNGEERNVFIIGELPRTLFALERQTGEGIRAGLEKGAAGIPFADIHDLGCALWEVGGSDRAGANGRVVAADEVLKENVEILHVYCASHDIQHTLTDLLGVRPAFLPRMARALGTLTLIGLINRVREELGRYLRRPGVVVVRPGESSAAAKHHRDLHRRLWWKEARGPQRATRKVVFIAEQQVLVELLLSGDWAVALVVEYYGDLPLAAVIEAMATYLPKVLVPIRMLKVSQSKWSGLDSA
jgi:hypothetical protein